jgi:hypothetical protein
MADTNEVPRTSSENRRPFYESPFLLVIIGGLFQLAVVIMTALITKSYVEVPSPYVFSVKADTNFVTEEGFSLRVIRTRTKGIDVVLNSTEVTMVVGDKRPVPKGKNCQIGLKDVVEDRVVQFTMLCQDSAK